MKRIVEAISSGEIIAHYVVELPDAATDDDFHTEAMIYADEEASGAQPH